MKTSRLRRAPWRRRAQEAIHIFLATSPIHRTAKLNMSCEQVLRARA